jgi:hypothetical protein
MTYRIAYGIETETLADPDEMVLLDLPDECADMDSEELEAWIDGNWQTDAIGRQQLVGFGDVVSSLRSLLPEMDASALEALIEGLYDATGQND